VVEKERLPTNSLFPIDVSHGRSVTQRARGRGRARRDGGPWRTTENRRSTERAVGIGTHNRLT
jgi:hypothetical protein